MAKTAKSKLVKQGPGVGRNGNLIPARKGEPSRGRKKGTLNSTTREMKEALLIAAGLSNHSKTNDLTGYLVHLADSKQAVFAGLLGRLIPEQAKLTIEHNSTSNTTLNINMPLNDMISQFEQRIKAAVPPRVQEAPPLLIEQDDVEVESDA